LAGDTEFDETGIMGLADALRDTNVIFTTPEKWDSVTRRWTDHAVIIDLIHFGSYILQSLLKQVKLLLIDEVHLVGDDRGNSELIQEARFLCNPGPTLEAVVSRMKRAVSNTSSEEPCRIIALSATLPNINDIANWLGATDHVFSFGIAIYELFFNNGVLGPEYRPVPLTLHTLGYKNSKENSFLFDRNLDFRVFDVISTYSARRPTLVFCPSRKGTAALAARLAQESQSSSARLSHMGDPKRSFIKDGSHQQRLKMAGQRCSDRALGRAVEIGVGFHSAALSASDRQLVGLRVVSTFLTLFVRLNGSFWMGIYLCCAQRRLSHLE
jgi:ATP-dependent DNA helicase HFM1/MER3